jgi:hypothetical protein
VWWPGLVAAWGQQHHQARLSGVGVSGDAKLLLVLAITVTGAIGVLVVLTLHVLSASSM